MSIPGTISILLWFIFHSFKETNHGITRINHVIFGLFHAIFSPQAPSTNVYKFYCRLPNIMSKFQLYVYILFHGRVRWRHACWNNSLTCLYWGFIYIGDWSGGYEDLGTWFGTVYNTVTEIIPFTNLLFWFQSSLTSLHHKCGLNPPIYILGL